MKFTASKKIIALVAAAAMLTGVRSLREFPEFEFFGGDRGW